MITAQAQAPVNSESEWIVARTTKVPVIEIEPVEKARALPEQYNTKVGEPKVSRRAIVQKADKAPVNVDIVGTAKQWGYFDGVSCEGRFLQHKTLKNDTGTPVGKWVFSPVAFADIDDPLAF